MTIGLRVVRVVAAMAALTALLLSLSSAHVASAADPIADFYHGKQLRMIIGYGEGGGYDLYGRLVAEFLGSHIPGNPTIVPENMPGAGGFKAADYMFTVAPKDGTVLGSLSQTLPLDVTTQHDTQIDLAKVRYIGRLTTEVDVGVGIPGCCTFKNFDDARKQQIVVGAAAGAGTGAMLPLALREYGGAKFKIVRGYKGAAEMTLAAERKEIDLIGGIGIPEMLVSHPDWVQKRSAVFLYQNGLSRNPLIKDVPTLPELGLTPQGKSVLRAIASTAEIGRSILTTPDVPRERLVALRNAFKAMLADPEFLAAVKKRNIEISPASGEAMDKIARDTAKLPAPVLAAVKSLEESN